MTDELEDDWDDLRPDRNATSKAFQAMLQPVLKTTLEGKLATKEGIQLMAAIVGANLAGTIADEYRRTGHMLEFAPLPPLQAPTMQAVGLDTYVVTDEYGNEMRFNRLKAAEEALHRADLTWRNLRESRRTAR